MSHNIIVFGICHTNTLGLIRSLGEDGFKPILVEVNNSKHSFINVSKYIANYHKVNSPEDGIELIQQLYSSKPGKSIILTGTDACAMVIDRNYNKLRPNFIISSVNNTEGELENLLDKERIRICAESVGLRTPKSWVIDCTNGIVLPHDLSYPCVIKAINSVAGRKDVNIYHTESELISGLQSLIVESHIIQIQEFIEKDYEILINGCVLSNGEIIMPCALKKIRHFPHGFGGLAYGIVTPNIDQYISTPLLKNFLEKIGYNGLFSIEFLIKDGNAYFLEINLRNDGTSYVSTYGGVNLASIWTKDALGLENIFNTKVSKEYLASSIIADFHNVTEKRIKVCQWFKQIIQSDVDLLWNKKDFKPALYYIINRVKTKL
ncbi:MAG: ATP-grasp domain-containing protein [Bacteroides sp.]|nr:ATP-grasp domain-containing protein [Bacteroides sp.]